METITLWFSPSHIECGLFARTFGFGVKAFSQAENTVLVHGTEGAFSRIFETLKKLGYKTVDRFSTQEWSHPGGWSVEVSGHGCGCASHAE